MKILAIDASSLVASVAILEEDKLLAEYTVNFKKTHSETLMPMLDEVCSMISLDLESIDAIAVAGGPGSFTGLRIGAATAKGLGLALDKPIVSIPTIEGLAYNLCGASDYVCPIMDARRNQTYTGIYKFNGSDMETIVAQTACGIDEIVDKINELSTPVTFLGDGVPVFREFINENCTVPVNFAPAHMNRQRAGAVGALAFTYYKEGRIQTAAEHRPDYLRLSQAERERLEKEKAVNED